MREDKDKSRDRDGEVEDEEEVGEEGGKKAKLRRSARLKKLEEMLAPEDVALFDEADERERRKKTKPDQNLPLIHVRVNWLVNKKGVRLGLIEKQNFRIDSSQFDLC